MLLRAENVQIYGQNGAILCNLRSQIILARAYVTVSLR